MDRSDTSEGTHTGNISYMCFNNEPQCQPLLQSQCTSGAHVGSISEHQQLLEAFYQLHFGTSLSYDYKLDYAIADSYQTLAQDMVMDGTPQTEMLAESKGFFQSQPLRVTFERYPDPDSERKCIQL